MLNIDRLYLEKMLGTKYLDNENTVNPNEAIASVDVSNSDMDKLNFNLLNCKFCELHLHRENVLVGSGNKKADIMFILPLPTQIEDKSGSTNKGRGNEMLKKIIEGTLNKNIEDFFITYAIKCFSKDASKEHAKKCMIYLSNQIDLIDPKILVTLGEESTSYLLGDITDFKTLRGHELQYKNRILIPTFHPLNIVKNPTLKKDVYYDFIRIKNCLEK